MNHNAVTQATARSGTAGGGTERQQPAMSGKALQLSVALQRTLDLDALLAIFAKEAGQVLPMEGMVYEHTAEDIELEHGTPGANVARYGLSVDGEELGELRISRSRPFDEQELLVAEHLIGALVYPLRNALLYREATMAALKDPLTGCYNRLMLERTVEREARLAHRHELPLSMIMLDLDQFKAINDLHGHLAGDRVLQNLVQCVGEMVRTTDLLARYGGDEFTLLLSNTPMDGAHILAERLRECVATRNARLLSDLAQPITASFGVAALEEGNGAKLLVSADEALLAAKRAGGNRVIATTA